MTQTMRSIGNHLICLCWMTCVTHVEKRAYFVKKIVMSIAYGASSENKIAQDIYLGDLQLKKRFRWIHKWFNHTWGQNIIKAHDKSVC